MAKILPCHVLYLDPHATFIHNYPVAEMLEKLCVEFTNIDVFGDQYMMKAAEDVKRVLLTMYPTLNLLVTHHSGT